MFLGGIAVLCLYGLFGTAAAVAVGLLSRAACRLVHVERTPRFLNSNEHSGNTQTQDMTGAMLVAPHCNATTWNLYVGDRGVIDALLNKPMISIDQHPLPLCLWFKVADALQLLAMTFAAAQKGWDGVAMVILMFLDWIFETSTDRNGIVADRFLKDKNIEISGSRLYFKGNVRIAERYL